MRLTGQTRLVGMLAALALLFAPCAALGDGDPASDILLIGDTFLPYQPKLSPNVAAAVTRTVAAAHAAGFPIKLAIIAGVSDLGAVPDMFGQPQRYADFLDQEISFNKHQLLLVVMPQGFGVSGAGPPAILAAIKPPSGGDADALGRAAIPAIGALAAHAGHPIVLPAIRPSSGSSGGGGSALLTFGAPLALVLVFAAAAVARGRRPRAGRARGEDDDDEDAGSRPALPGAAPEAPR